MCKHCHDLLCVTFGIDPSEVTYVENPWSGGGNAGPAVEVIVGGLELATLVFMNLAEDDDGDVEIKNVKYSEMPLQIIDTGYGLEILLGCSRHPQYTKQFIQKAWLG